MDVIAFLDLYGYEHGPPGSTKLVDAATVWGHAFVATGAFEWHNSHDGLLLLRCTFSECGLFNFWPWARLREVVEGRSICPGEWITDLTRRIFLELDDALRNENDPAPEAWIDFRAAVEADGWN